MSVLDTTFFIDLFRRDSGAIQLWNSIFATGAVGTYSAITAFELWVGRLSAEEEAFYLGLLLLLEELPLTSSAARQAGSWLRGYRGPTAERLVRDALVAATALERGQSVHTRNVRDFGRFGVTVESY